MTQPNQPPEGRKVEFNTGNVKNARTLCFMPVLDPRTKQVRISVRPPTQSVIGYMLEAGVPQITNDEELSVLWNRIDLMQRMGFIYGYDVKDEKIVPKLLSPMLVLAHQGLTVVTKPKTSREFREHIFSLLAVRFDAFEKGSKENIFPGLREQLERKPDDAAKTAETAGKGSPGPAPDHPAGEGKAAAKEAVLRGDQQQPARKPGDGLRLLEPEVGGGDASRDDG